MKNFLFVIIIILISYNFQTGVESPCDSSGDAIPQQLLLENYLCFDGKIQWHSNSYNDLDAFIINKTVNLFDFKLQSEFVDLSLEESQFSSDVDVVDPECFDLEFLNTTYTRIQSQGEVMQDFKQDPNNLSYSVVIKNTIENNLLQIYTGSCTWQSNLSYDANKNGIYTDSVDRPYLPMEPQNSNYYFLISMLVSHEKLSSNVYIVSSVDLEFDIGNNTSYHLRYTLTLNSFPPLIQWNCLNNESDNLGELYISNNASTWITGIIPVNEILSADQGNLEAQVAGLTAITLSLSAQGSMSGIVTSSIKNIALLRTLPTILQHDLQLYPLSLWNETLEKDLLHTRLINGEFINEIPIIGSHYSELVLKHSARFLTLKGSFILPSINSSLISRLIEEPLKYKTMFAGIYSTNYQNYVINLNQICYGYWCFTTFLNQEIVYNTTILKENVHYFAVNTVNLTKNCRDIWQSSSINT